MVQIKPFPAITYNQDKVKKLSAVVCPPYDVISTKKQDYYYQQDPNNFIRVLLRKDNPSEDKYKVSAETYRGWKRDKVFIQENEPALYFYSQQYNVRGEKKVRYGFIALLHLGEDRPSVYAHENTRPAPKEDRLKLLSQVKANLSPIFAVFTDKKRVIQLTFKEKLKDKVPFIQLVDDEKTEHKLWRVNDPKAIRWIQECMLKEDVFIADGHHRYEVSRLYRDEIKKGSAKLSAEDPLNYIMCYFTDGKARDLTIFPIHRIVNAGTIIMEELLKKLQEYFYVEEIKDKAKFFFLLEKAGQSEHSIGVYKDKRYWLLRLKNIKILKGLAADKSYEYVSLDVSILNYIIFDKVMGIDLADKGHIDFNSNAQELIEKVDNDSNLIVFFLNSVKIEQIIRIALGGEKMPPKSTYFYPKVLSGLVINSLE
ncbi:MAG: DUF1015 domain-containing protein [Candidatus Omnitrophota bacterium]|nr:DUF1015 domain-containing protein [Candidatus Omnitrophota bacterium]